MRVNAGALDRRLEIQTSTVSQDGLGQATSAYTPGLNVYAQRLEMRTQDAARAGQRDSFALARFLIRYRTDLTTSMRVRDGNRLYDIKAIDELPDRRTALILTVEEVRSDAAQTPVVPFNAFSFGGEPLAYTGDYITAPQGVQ